MRKLFYISFLCVLTTFTFCSKNGTPSGLEQKSAELKKKEIKDFLISKGVAPENIFFTDTLSKNNVLEFSSIQEFEAFWEQTEIEIQPFENPKPTEKKYIATSRFSHNGGNRIFFSGSKDIKRTLGLEKQINISGSYVKSPVSYEISDFYLVSYMTGFVAGTSYEHMYGGVYYTSLPDVSLRFSGQGVLSRNISYGGIGTIYRTPINFSGTINDMSALFD